MLKPIIYLPVLCTFSGAQQFRITVIRDVPISAAVVH